jgi:Tol biopolymer transport system component
MPATKQHIVRPLKNINSQGYEDGPFIASDQGYLIFESDRPGGIGGSIDLYISFRGEGDVWTAPINMGPEINTIHSERFASVSPDGNYLLFGSDRRIVDGKRNFDIYWMKSSIIEELRIATVK